MNQLPQGNEVEIEMGCQWKWNIEWNTYRRWMKRNFKSPEREMKQRMKHLPERMKNYSQGLRIKQVPWMNENSFHSFLVVDQDFVWYSSAVHDVSGSYQSLRRFYLHSSESIGTGWVQTQKANISARSSMANVWMRGRIMFSLLDPIMGKAIYLLVLKRRQLHWRTVGFYKAQRLAYNFEKWCLHASTNGLPRFTLDGRAQRDKRSANDE